MQILAINLGHLFWPNLANNGFQLVCHGPVSVSLFHALSQWQLLPEFVVSVGISSSGKAAGQCATWVGIAEHCLPQWCILLKVNCVGISERGFLSDYTQFTIIFICVFFFQIENQLKHLLGFTSIEVSLAAHREHWQVVKPRPKTTAKI